MIDIGRLEQELIVACRAVREYTVTKRRGIKDIGKDCSAGTTDFKERFILLRFLQRVDIHNQESIISHMGTIFLHSTSLLKKI